MNWQEIVEFLGGAGLFATALGYVGKRAVDGFVAGRTEAYKSDLKRITTEHTIRFQRLHAERAAAIRALYSRLVTLDDLLHSTLRGFQAVGEPPLIEKVKSLSTSFNDLRVYFLPRRIFFAEPVCRVVDAMLELAKDMYLDITTYEVDPTHSTYQNDRQLSKERRDQWNKARAIHAKDFADLKVRLEAEFREMLGIQ